MKPIGITDISGEKILSGIFSGAEGQTCCWASFDRTNGKGNLPYNSRNVSYHVGDREEVVKTNRQLIKQELACEHLLSAHQVHGTEIFRLDDPLETDMEPAGYDALITNQMDVGLMIQQADCQAILLYDPVHNAIGAVHCGWRGSVEGIIGRVISRMMVDFGTQPEMLHAVISPSLGPCCAEFINHERELPFAFRSFSDGKNHFDFWQISRQQLRDGGVRDRAIKIAGVCTACNPNYFSYRRSRNHGLQQTGRNCSVVVLRG